MFRIFQWSYEKKKRDKSEWTQNKKIYYYYLFLYIIAVDICVFECNDL